MPRESIMSACLSHRLRDTIRSRIREGGGNEGERKENFGHWLIMNGVEDPGIDVGEFR